MWGMFFLDSLVGVALLYLVGFLLLRAFRFKRLFALAAAPIVSTVCFEALAIVFDKANVFAGWTSLFLPMLFVAVVVYVAGAVTRRKQGKALPSREATAERAAAVFDLKMVVLYGGLALFVGFFVFVCALDGPECFNETYDNLTHLGLVRSFLESGHYSTLSASLYRDLGMTGTYYPAAWHLVTALVADITNTSILLATNAMNYICCCVVYPVSCLCLMRQIFGDKKNIIIAGAFASIAFVTFPWFFVVYGVLESNLFGFIMVPVMLAAVMRLFSSGIVRGERIAYLIMCIVCVVFCLFAQPNAFFAVMLFAIPYLAWRIWDATDSAPRRYSMRVRVGLVALFLFAMLIVWYACYKAPFLYDTTHFIWPPVASKVQAFVNVVLFSNTWSPVALMAAVLVFVGLFVMLKTRRYGWLAVALGMAAVIAWSGVCLEGRLDQFLGGFWYSDWRRTAALQAMIAVPVAAIGIAQLYEWLPRYLKSNVVMKLVVSAVLLGALFIPNFLLRGMEEVKTPFGYFNEMMEEYYSMDQGDDEVIFSESERAFVAQVKDIVGDKIVYNIPYDGSFFAYQSDGLRTIYRLPYTGSGQDTDQEIVQAALNEYASNSEVQRAIANLGAEYVLLLDYGHIPHHKNSPDPYYKSWPDYLPENWTGVAEITEDTPGFELVLSEGDMRLYRIIEAD